MRILTRILALLHTIMAVLENGGIVRPRNRTIPPFEGEKRGEICPGPLLDLVCGADVFPCLLGCRPEALTWSLVSY